MHNVEHLKQYRRFKYIVKTKIKKAKADAWNRKCAEIDSIIEGLGSKKLGKYKHLQEKHKGQNDIECYKFGKLEIVLQKFSNKISIKLNKCKLRERRHK